MICGLKMRNLQKRSVSNPCFYEPVFPTKVAISAGSLCVFADFRVRCKPNFCPICEITQRLENDAENGTSEKGLHF